MPITVNGSGTVSGVSPGGLSASQLVLGTAQNSTSGTSIDFTGIPNWVKRITVMFNGVSTTGAGSDIALRVGSGSITSSGYNSSSVRHGAAAHFYRNSTAAFLLTCDLNSGDLFYGRLSLINVSGNSWILSGLIDSTTNANELSSSHGGIQLGGTLDRIRITTINGTDTFDAGSINIMYE